jgi:hypothetical protein
MASPQTTTALTCSAAACDRKTQQTFGFSAEGLKKEEKMYVLVYANGKQKRKKNKKRKEKKRGE